MSADLLKRAAEKLRRHAEIATKSEPEIPWTAYRLDEAGRHVIRVDLRWRDEEEAMPSGYTVADMSMDAPGEGWPVGQAVVDSQYIALMHPPVALALAEWFEVEAKREAHSLAEFGYRVVANEAAALARAILREDPK